jgi:glycosyltransferase involved in cell wall biosynthesis
MPKILLVATMYPYPEYKDGLSKINSNLIKDNPHYEMDMLCIDDATYPEPEKCTFFKIKRKPATSKIKTIFSYITSFKPSSILRYSSYINTFRNFILEHHMNYDVIHLSSPYMIEIIDDLPKIIVSKIIVFPIDSMALYWTRRMKIESNVLMKFLYKIELFKCIRFEKIYYKKFRKVVFVSTVDEDYARDLDSGIESLSIPNGVDIEFFNKSKDTSVKETSLIFTGDMSYAPNEDAAIFLIQEILPRIKPIFKPHLYLVGQRPGDKLIKLSTENVTITGFVEDIRPYLDAAAIYVSPLRFGSGIKNKILEAMAMQKVVIGTEISFDGIDCTSGRDCLLVSIDPEKIVFEIESVLGNPAIYANLGGLARRLVEDKYAWDSIRKRYGELYENSISY